jgi:hypothetical protein
VFTGRVKTPEFFRLFMDEWQPKLCLMATFGQKIPNALINHPALGFFTSTTAVTPGRPIPVPIPLRPWSGTDGNISS